MSEPLILEAELQNTVRSSESTLDRQTLTSLAESREQALHSGTSWIGGARGVFSAGIVTCALVIAVFVPLTNSPESIQPAGVDIADENLQLLMEDPEFFLWVSNSYGALSQ